MTNPEASVNPAVALIDKVLAEGWLEPSWEKQTRKWRCKPATREQRIADHMWPEFTEPLVPIAEAVREFALADPMRRFVHPPRSGLRLPRDTSRFPVIALLPEKFRLDAQPLTSGSDFEWSQPLGLTAVHVEADENRGEATIKLIFGQSVVPPTPEFKPWPSRVKVGGFLCLEIRPDGDRRPTARLADLSYGTYYMNYIGHASARGRDCILGESSTDWYGLDKGVETPDIGRYLADRLHQLPAFIQNRTDGWIRKQAMLLPEH